MERASPIRANHVSQPTPTVFGGRAGACPFTPVGRARRPGSRPGATGDCLPATSSLTGPANRYGLMAVWPALVMPSRSGPFFLFFLMPFRVSLTPHPGAGPTCPDLSLLAFPDSIQTLSGPYLGPILTLPVLS